MNKLKPVNENAGNIFRINPPYYLLNKDTGSERRKVIFFGNCFKNLPHDVDLDEYIKVTNKCLDFVRKECAGYQLIYKPHPAETNESRVLNLSSFETEKDNATGEIFLYKNLSQIKYVFSSHSLASITALSLGLNSYVFAKLFKSAFGDFTKNGFENFLKGMPETYFISDLNSGLKENKLIFSRNDFLEKQWREILRNHKGTVRFVADDPWFLMPMISFSRLIKNIAPDRKVEMAIGRHERWDRINPGDIMQNFDNLTFFPLVYYSFKPSRLRDLIKTVFMVKKFKVNPDDIIFGFGPEAFIINCFMSYFRKNFRIGLILKMTFDLNYNFKTPLKSSDYSIKQVRLFFITFIEPLLGLYKTVGRLHRQGDRGGFGIGRYQAPLNEIFDITYILKPMEDTNAPVVNKVW